MVKINDPRGDSAAIAMRFLRATNAFKTIKKTVKKSKTLDEDKLDLHKTDKIFYNDFVSCPESIKQELIFLWEELGDLFEKLENKGESKEDNIQLNLDEKPPPPPPLQSPTQLQSPLPKRTYIMGP